MPGVGRPEPAALDGAAAAAGEAAARVRTGAAVAARPSTHAADTSTFRAEPRIEPPLIIWLPAATSHPDQLCCHATGAPLCLDRWMRGTRPHRIGNGRASGISRQT